MKGKLVWAFVSGALVASVIVYVAVKPEPLANAVMDAVNAPPPIATAPTPPAAPAPEPPPPVSDVTTPAPHVPPAPKTAAPRHPIAPRRIRVHEKPSPMPPAVPRNSPAVVARVQPLPPLEPAQSLPAPTPAPEPQKPAVSAPPVAPPPQPVAPPVSIPENAPEVRTPHTVVLAAGTTLAVRIGETISSARSRVGDSFLATLEQPLVIDGFVIAERGARLEGRVLEVTQAGRPAGPPSHLGIVLVRLATTDRQNVRIRTIPYQRDGAKSTGSDVTKVGGGTLLGAAIGAIAGGGKGAAIGAGAGAAAGGGMVLVSRGKPVDIPVETRLSFLVQEPVTITEKLD